MSPIHILQLMKDTYNQWNEDKASRLAAALAYYTVFSLPPLLIVVIAVAGAFFGNEVAHGQIVDQLKDLVGVDGAKIIETIIAGTNKPGAASGITASALSIGILIFGATGVVIQLQDALNTIWEVVPKPGSNIRTFIFSRFLSFGMILGVAFMLLVSLVISATLAIFSTYLSGFVPGIGFISWIADFIISFGVETFLFALMFKFLPDVIITWSDVIMGAVLTALLFTIGKFAIGLYLGKSTFSSTYGAAGSLVVLLVWIYYSAQILLLGAEFTQVYARRYGSRIQPAEYAVAVTEKARAQEGIPRK